MVLAACLALTVAGCARGQPVAEPTSQRVVADFGDGALDGWQSSLSGEYYRGGQGQKGLAIVRDEARGSQVLSAQVRWADPQASEPAFITRFLPQPIPRQLITSVSFSYRLSAYRLDDAGGFKVRLRYSDTEFTDYAVSTGRPLLAGEWQAVSLPTQPSSSVRNIYGQLFASVREITFRLDDVDTENAEFELRLDDLRLTLRSPAAHEYEPRVRPRPANDWLGLLYLRHSAEGFFPMLEALTQTHHLSGAWVWREAPPSSPSVRECLFRGLHFPLFDFPTTREEVLENDLIVMVDVDPYVLTWEQATWIADAVASGVGFLFVAGPNTLYHAQDFKAPIRAVLPASFASDARDAGGGGAEVAQPAHPAVCGLDADRLGTVGSVSTVEPRPGAEVLLRVGDRPLLIAGEVGKGRTALLTTWPQIRESREQCFFTADHSVALLAQVLRWLTRQEGAVRIVSVAAPPREITGAGPVQCQVTVAAETPTEARVQWSLDGEEVWRSERTVIEGSAELSHAFDLTPRVGPLRPRELRASVWGPKLQLLDERTFRTRVLPPVRLAAYTWHGRRSFAPGRTLRCGVEVSAPDPGLQAVARMLEGWKYEEATPVWDLGSQSAASNEVDFEGVLPNLERGCYWLDFALRGTDGEVLATDALPCCVVDNLDRNRFFPIISVLGTSGGGHLLDEHHALQRVRDLDNTGFNTIAYGGLRRFVPKRVTDLSAQIDMQAEVDAHYFYEMASILEYTHYTRLTQEGKGDPSPFSLESPAATRTHVQPYLDVADANPRLVSVKVIDEPSISEGSLAFDEHEKRAYAERYGGELRPLKEIGDDPLARLHLAQFLGDYVAEEYRQGYAIKHEQERSWDLLLTYMSPGLGYGRSFTGLEDVLKWSRYTDRIDFDVYPYFYPTSQKLRMVQANYAHAFQRNVAQHLGKPFGFYMELDDRNYPFQVNPPEASAECAFTAIGQGVNYLNSFINQAFATGCQSRPERWALLGEELPGIRRLGPLLCKLQRPPAPVSLLYPMTQAKIRNGYAVPHYAFALLNSAFGDTDLLHEEVLPEAGLPTSCRALVLLRTELLSRETFEAITAFVQAGGLLVLDGSLPATDEAGTPLVWPFDLASARSARDEGTGIKTRRQAVGQGMVIALEADVEAQVKEVVEGADLASPEIADPG
ncbi:MAG: hypothetical protein FJX74_00550, partial [Armatimonadetes bacterium]|nr:hypothetical protein [Armatimonadota bacterium]